MVSAEVVRITAHDTLDVHNDSLRNECRVEAPLQASAGNYALYARAAIPVFDLGLRYRVDSRRGVVVQLVRAKPCHG